MTIQIRIWLLSLCVVTKRNYILSYVFLELFSGHYLGVGDNERLSLFFHWNHESTSVRTCSDCHWRRYRRVAYLLDFRKDSLCRSFVCRSIRSVSGKSYFRNNLVRQVIELTVRDIAHVRIEGISVCLKSLDSNSVLVCWNFSYPSTWVPKYAVILLVRSIK